MIGINVIKKINSPKLRTADFFIIIEDLSGEVSPPLITLKILHSRRIRDQEPQRQLCW